MGALAAVKRSRGVQQFTALYLKNALVAWRNKRATLLRLFAPLFFLLLALLIDKALQADSSNNSDYKDVPNPPITAITPIPLCTADLYMAKKTNCFELIVSPNNTVAQAVINEVIAYNTQQGTPITAQFAPTMADANNFLLENPDTVIAGVHFQFDGPQPWGNNVSWAQLTGFILQTNSTVKYFKGTFQNPNTFVQLPAQSAVQRALTKLLLQEAGSTNVSNNLAWETSLQVFAHPTIATQSLLGQVLGPFVFAACMFSFVVQIANVVAEKELGLRAALRTMGMTDTSFWGSWCMWEVTLSFVLANAIIIFGLIMQFSLFLHNNYGLLFFLFFLFLLAMSSLAMLLAAFMKKTASAVSLGFTIFIIGWVMQSVVIFGVPYTPDYYKSAGGAITAIFSLFPWDLLTKGFLDLGAATVGNNPGLEWSQRSSYCQNIENTNARPGYNPNTEYIDFECVMSLNSIYWILTAEWIVYYLLAVYLDNIVPNEHGVRKSIWYPFVPSYWCPVDRDAAHHVAAAAKGTLPVDGEQQVVLDEDVAAEEDLVKGLLPHRTGKAGALSDAEAGTAGRNAVEVFGLQKRYNGSRGCFGHSCSCCGVCCTFEAVPPFWAIKGSWFHIPQNQLFCLLGPNGAGKTTTINCLTGLLPPTNGEALVYGEAISSVGGINRIRSMMGVCPQFDVLWGELTGREHLRAYGSVKGIPWDEVSQEADRLLEKVKLTYAADQRTSAYSGGMRRRLSVAIALLGDPKIVYLDEPTTGMDPISRRYVWDIIQEAKEGRAIVLTTHSMEEADILGDRIAIMARGRLRCVGTSIRLKQRFGAGYKVAVSVMSAQASQQDSEGLAQRAATVKSYFLERLGLSPVEESRAYIQFLVEREREPQLITFLAQLEQDRNSMGITDVQLSLTSLEEVFLTIARNAELEAAMAAGEGTQEVLTTALDGATFTVPLGAELVMDPTSQKYYKVKWVTDDNGKLVVMEAAPAQQDGSQLAYTYSAPAPSQMQLTAPPSIPVAAPVVGAPIGSNAYTVSATSGARPPSGGSRIGSSLLSAPPNAFASGTATAGSRPASQGSRLGSQQGPVPRVSGTAGIELPGIPKY